MCIRDSLGGAPFTSWADAPWSEINTADDVVGLIGPFTSYIALDVGTYWELPSSDVAWLDIAFHDGTAYVLETTDSGELQLHVSSNGTAWSTFEVPMTIPIDYRTTETLDVLYGSIHVDADRLMMAAIGTDSVGDTHVGWSFVGGPG